MNAKLLFLSFLPLVVVGPARAQVVMNPQLGANFTTLTQTPDGVTTSANFGYQAGIDFRLGDRLYFQPGAFFGRSVTAITPTGMDTTFIQYDLVRTTAKLKALLGYNIIHDGPFRLRLNVGPTYEALISVDNKDDRIAFNRKDYNNGSFNMDAGVGIDLWVVSLEGGLSYGLSNAYKDSGKLMKDSKYFTGYVTLGVVLGGNPG